MAEANTEKVPVDGMERDARGFWQPERGTAPPSPLFAWPPRPLKAIKWLFGYPGFLLPWNVIYMVVAALTWLYLQPALSRCVDFRLDWMLEMYGRNLGMLLIINSAWHLRLWSRKAQGLRFKYTSTWLATGNRKFLSGSQLRDNVFWSVASACTVWTAYEILMVWAYANEIIPYVDPREQPVYFVLMLILVPMWRLFHFYWTHRLLHWRPLYKAAHYLHHKNINVGPWSGLSMHPVEHVIYFSCILIHWIVPSHPIHMLFNAQHTAFTPAQGHSGFENLVFNEKPRLLAGSYFHQLHHRYFECNYGENGLPFDKWFGTWHDGSLEAHAAMREKRKTTHSVLTEAE